MTNPLWDNPEFREKYKKIWIKKNKERTKTLKQTSEYIKGAT